MTDDSAVVMTDESSAVTTTQPTSKSYKAAKLVGVIVIALCVVIAIGAFLLSITPVPSKPSASSPKSENPDAAASTTPTRKDPALVALMEANVSMFSE